MKDYIIKKIESKNNANWEIANIAEVNVQPWRDYPCPYETKAQLLYTDDALLVHLSTTETELRAENRGESCNVCEDSCMEFFLSPDENNSKYFNFEFNPIGAICLFVCDGRDKYEHIKFDKKIFNLKSVITTDGWELFYEIPFSFMKEHFANISETMRGNFYKCGDKTEHIHYACWNEIDLIKPEFHCPQFFGNLIFE